MGHNPCRSGVSNEDVSVGRIWTEINPWKQIRTCFPQHQVHFLPSKFFLLFPSGSIYNPNSSSRKVTLGKTRILSRGLSDFIDEPNLPSHSTQTNLEALRKHPLTQTKQPPPNYYLHSGKHLSKLQMFYTQNRLEPDCKHLLFFQCTDPLAPWLHVFATQTAFNLTLKQ